MFDEQRSAWIAMAKGVIGYIPPGWAHRSINTGSEDCRFLAVDPSSAGHDDGWVLEHGIRQRAFSAPTGHLLTPYSAVSA